MNWWSHRFSQNMNQKLQRFLPCSVAQYRAEILTIFGSYFGRNDDFINSFCNFPTFSSLYTQCTLFDMTKLSLCSDLWFWHIPWIFFDFVDLSWNVASVLVRFSPFPSLNLALETWYLSKVRKSIFLGFNSSKKPTKLFS